MPLAGDYSAVMTEPAAKPETLFPSPQRDTPEFDAQFQGRLEDLIHWRRDVRRFRAEISVMGPDGEENVNQKAHTFRRDVS